MSLLRDRFKLNTFFSQFQYFNIFKYFWSIVRKYQNESNNCYWPCIF